MNLPICLSIYGRRVCGVIEDIKYWTYKVLPLVYDDSLSYYELVNKCVTKINEMIPIVNESKETITAEVQRQIQEMLNDGTLDNLINQQIFGELNEKLTKAETNISELTSKTNELETETNSNTEQINTLKNTVEINTQNIGQNTKNITANTTNITQLDGKVTKLSSDFSSYKTETDLKLINLNSKYTIQNVPIQVGTVNPGGVNGSVPLEKAGYTPFAIGGFKTGNNTLAFCDAFLNGANLEYRIRNMGSAAATNVYITITVIYMKN